MAIRVTYDGPIDYLMRAARDAGVADAQRENQQFNLRQRQVSQQDRSLDLRERGMTTAEQQFARQFAEQQRQFDAREQRITDYQDAQQQFARDQYQTRRQDMLDDRAAEYQREVTRLGQPLMLPDGMYMTDGNKRRLADLNEQISTVMSDPSLSQDQRLGTLQALSAERDMVLNTAVPDTRDTRPLEEQFESEIVERDGMLFSRDRNGAWREVATIPARDEAPPPWVPDQKLMQNVYDSVVQRLTSQTNDGPSVTDWNEVGPAFQRQMDAMREVYERHVMGGQSSAAPDSQGETTMPPPDRRLSWTGLAGIQEQNPEKIQRWAEIGSQTPEEFMQEANGLMQAAVGPDLMNSPVAWALAGADTIEGDPIPFLSRISRNPAARAAFQMALVHELLRRGDITPEELIRE